MGGGAHERGAAARSWAGPPESAESVSSAAAMGAGEIELASRKDNSFPLDKAVQHRSWRVAVSLGAVPDRGASHGSSLGRPCAGAVQLGARRLSRSLSCRAWLWPVYCSRRSPYCVNSCAMACMCRQWPDVLVSEAVADRARPTATRAAPRGRTGLHGCGCARLRGAHRAGSFASSRGPEVGA